MTSENNLAILDGDTLKNSYPEGIDWNLPLEKISLVELFNNAVTKFADKPCFDFYGNKITYKELEELTDKAAKGFQKMGVKKGTRVGLYMPNTQYHPILFFGALKAGAIVVNYSTQYVEEELKHQIEDSDTTILVTADAPSDLFKNAKSLLKKTGLQQVLAFHLDDAMGDDRSWMPAKYVYGLPIAKILNKFKNFFDFAAKGQVSYMKGFLNNDGQYEAVPVDPDDTAVLQYTGGTSGTPKGAELTHYNLTANAQQIAEFISDSPEKPDSEFTLKAGESKMLAPLPFFHVFGMSATMLTPIHLGMETITILDPRPDELETNLKVIERTKPDAIALVPKVLEFVLKSPLLEKYDYSSVKGIVTGGAAMPIKVHEKINELCDARVFPGWGLTETSPVLTVNPLYGTERSGSAGIPVPGVKIRVCDIDEDNKVFKIGETGELQAAGPNIMKGYADKPDETDKVMVVDEEGTQWFKTGDVGHVTEDGHVIITDRIKRMINVMGTGKKAFSYSIEKAIDKHPDIAECCVVAVNKGTDREAAKAFVRVKEGASLEAEDLKAHLASHLSKLEIPRYYEFVTEPLPRTMKGDVQWKQLEDMEAEKANQGGNTPAPAP